MRFASEFQDSRRLRLHTDCNQEEGVLVFPYFRSTLLALIQDGPELSIKERKKILRHVGEAIQELHGRDWIHIGTSSALNSLAFHQADLFTLQM